MSLNKGWFKKGHPKYSSKGDFKKGHKGNVGNSFGKANKGRKMIKLPIGFKNGMWRGDNAKYSAMHLWIVRCKGNPKYCDDCGKIGEKQGRIWNLHWSNIDHTYKRNLDDYIGRCPPCHKIYDIKNNLNGNNFNSHL